MEIKIENSKVTHLNFPKRKLRSTKESNLQSPRSTIILDPQTVSICGTTGDVLLKCKIDPSLKNHIINGNVSFKEIYFPENIDPEVSEALSFQEKLKLNGKTIEEVDIFALIESGILITSEEK
jgi:hypothetical protein